MRVNGLVCASNRAQVSERMSLKVRVGVEREISCSFDQLFTAARELNAQICHKRMWLCICVCG